MSLKDWERDVTNRQRNIVFPDTNLNEGRFYRNIASGKAVFSRGQKVCLVVIVLFVDDHDVLRIGADNRFSYGPTRPWRHSDWALRLHLSIGNSSVLGIFRS
jgi:hypothetical protein